MTVVFMQDRVQQHASAWPGLAAIWLDASSQSCPTGCKADAQPKWIEVRHSTCLQRRGGAAGGNRGNVPWHCTSVNLESYSKCLVVPLLCAEGTQALPCKRVLHQTLPLVHPAGGTSQVSNGEPRPG